MKNLLITVFYDGRCGLCAREIRYYKKIAPQKTFNWVDITEDASLFLELGYTVEQGLKLMHVQDAQGRMQVGIDAFITMWRPLKGWRWLAVWVSLPGIHFFVKKIYHLFAKWRFKKTVCYIGEK